jgi:hypothetical protein
MNIVITNTKPSSGASKEVGIEPKVKQGKR